jgi:UV DNA damage endonuclease
MGIGLCCHYLTPKIKRNGNIEYVNSLNESSLQYGQYLNKKYSSIKIEDTWINNINNLLSAIKTINAKGINVFRFSSSIFPLYDLEKNLLESSKTIKNSLLEIGKFIKSHNMRLTTHPDQFVVISSNRQDVIDKSIIMLQHHAWIMDQMELDESPYYSINIHGGTRGNSSILIDSINSLPFNVKSRLTLENDERSYNVKDLYAVFEKTTIPIVFDSHHHLFNDANLESEDGFLLAKSTWGSIKPLTHLSNTSPGLENANFSMKRKHSEYVHYIPEWQLLASNNDSIDVDFEFKMKNLAIFDAVEKFKIKL